MKSSTECNNNHEITLESVTKDFELWQQTKTTHRIPDHIWDKVFLLYPSDKPVSFMNAHPPQQHTVKKIT